MRGRCVGTMTYCAPEMLNKMVPDPPPRSLDMYSLGVILFFLLSADYPYEEDATVLRRMRPPDMALEAWSSVSADAVNLVRELMDADPTSRPTAQDVLASQWFSKDVDSSPLAVPL